MLPSFVIIGAMKSGTSSLHNYLASHPDLVPSTVKETDFFTTDSSFEKGRSWYEKKFKGTGKYAFEASPNYAKRHLFPNVSKRMHSLLPEAKLIFILRDPIERAVSHYIHNYSYGREMRPFSEAIRENNSNYILTSQYFFQLQGFLKYYPDEQIFLAQSEQLRENTTKIVNDVCSFLGITNECSPAVLENKFHKSSHKNVASSLERWIVKKTDNRKLAAIVSKLTSPLNQPIKKPELNAADLELLRVKLSSDIEALRNYSKCKFAGWSV
tara:strand:- start:137 stop:943 length:807 start_codon:yes stop_codon:yes gene_type:complete